MHPALAFIADAQASELMKPAYRALYHPAVAPQLLSAFDPTSRDPGHDLALAQQATVPLGIIPFVGVQLLRTTARSPLLLPDGHNRID
jgi:hypothetical protein